MTETDIFSDTTPDTTEPPTNFGNLMFGVVLIVAGLVWLLAALDVVDLSWRSITAGALVFVGIALVVGATQGSHPGLITAGVILTVVLGLASTLEGVLDVPFRGGIGDADYAPAATATIIDPYRLAIGDLTVDLRATELEQGVTEVEASVAIGQLVIRVPEDIAVQVEGSVGAGRLFFDGREYSGTGVDEVVTDDGFAGAATRIHIIAKVGLGNIEVQR